MYDLTEGYWDNNEGTHLDPSAAHSSRWSAPCIIFTLGMTTLERLEVLEKKGERLVACIRAAENVTSPVMTLYVP